MARLPNFLLLGLLAGAAVLLAALVIFDSDSPKFTGEFDLSQETTYEPCLQAPGSCLCVRRHEECLERLRNFQDFPIYWLGESYEGLPLASVYQDDFGLEGARRKRQFRLEYGSCIIEAGQEGCGIPLSIFISPYCESPVDPQTIELEYQKSEIRGAAAYDHGRFLRTGSVAIGISGGGERVALNLVRANGGEPSSPEDPFDPPVSECYPASPSPPATP